MKKLNELESKIVGIIGVNSMALISGLKLAFIVSLLASIVILFKRDKTPSERLKSEIKHYLNYSNEDAEEYSKKLQELVKEEYQKSYKESLISREE